jgi:phage baseplate assembly protein V
MSDHTHDYDHVVQQLRGLTGRAVVQAIDDTGADQMLTLAAHAGRTRSQVPVHQQFGLSSRAPLNGAVAPVIALGGDPSDLIALPPSNPSLSRAGGLAEGETVLYDSVGQAVYLQNGRIVRVQAATEMRVEIAGEVVLDVTATLVTVNAALQVNGKITATGDVVGNGISLDQHVHPAGTPNTGTPQG